MLIQSLLQWSALCRLQPTLFRCKLTSSGHACSGVLLTLVRGICRILVCTYDLTALEFRGPTNILFPHISWGSLEDLLRLSTSLYRWLTWLCIPELFFPPSITHSRPSLPLPGTTLSNKILSNKLLVLAKGKSRLSYNPTHTKKKLYRDLRVLLLEVCEIPQNKIIGKCTIEMNVIAFHFTWLLFCDLNGMKALEVILCTNLGHCLGNQMLV